MRSVVYSGKCVGRVEYIAHVHIALCRWLGQLAPTLLAEALANPVVEMLERIVLLVHLDECLTHGGEQVVCICRERAEAVVDQCKVFDPVHGTTLVDGEHEVCRVEAMRVVGTDGALLLLLADRWIVARD